MSCLYDILGLLTQKYGSVQTHDWPAADQIQPLVPELAARCNDGAGSLRLAAHPRQRMTGTCDSLCHTSNRPLPCLTLPLAMCTHTLRRVKWRDHGESQVLMTLEAAQCNFASRIKQDNPTCLWTVSLSWRQGQRCCSDAACSK